MAKSSSLFTKSMYSFFFLIFFMFISETERQSTSGGGAEREGDTESEAGSRLRAVSTEPNMGSNSQTVRS